MELKQGVEEIEEENLFAAALALPAIERDHYLQRACRSNIQLFERLRDLVEQFDRGKSYFKEAQTIAGHCDRIGPYQLLSELGEGGCGIAYLAEQTTPVKRHVALKIIKPGMDTKAVIMRFEAERQVLALLDHPNVAKVFDAGATIEGRPFFVMELIRGIRITEYCTQSRLSIAQRLSLFVQVCMAIQHAHQKGIIHRDIKPSNVLVTMHDGLPLAKVIDFGIAKAIQGKLIDQTLHTEIDQIMGTPAYLSPEQTQPTHAAVDMRSDIYSLGVLLYELLTGYTPFDARELAEVSIDRLRRRICNEEPVRPSRRLSALLNDSIARVAAYNATTATKLVKQIREDLDWIVMRCLEKEPLRRYQTVAELIADVERYLRHEPVLARPPNLIYTVRKLARRNRIAFASALAAIVFLLCIIAFAVIMALQAQRIATERDLAERERNGAQRVSNVAISVFAVADPFRSLAHQVSGHALLEQAVTSIERELRDQPAPRARLLRVVALAYLRRGEFKPAVYYLKEAVQVLSQMPGAENDAFLAIVDLSSALRVSGDRHEARKILLDAERLAHRAGLERSAGYASLLLNRGRMHMKDGRIHEARADFERSLSLYREISSPRSLAVAEVLSELSTSFIWTDDHALAEQTARQSIEIFELMVPARYPDRVQTEVNLAEALYLQNRLDEAAAILVQAIPKRAELFGRNSVEVADILDRLAGVKQAQRRLDEAERYSRDAVATVWREYGDRHSLSGIMASTLGKILAEREKYEEAEATLREALRVFSVALPPDHQHTASAEYFLGEVLLATNRLREAEEVLTTSMNRWTRSGAPPWRAMRSASALGEALYRQGRSKEGERYLSESLRGLSAEPSTDANDNDRASARDKARARAARYVRRTPPSTVATQ